MKGHDRLGMEATETGPPELHRRQAGKDEAGRRDRRAMNGAGAVLRIDPQRVVVADSFGESEDGHPVGDLVVDESVRTDFRADARPHVREHLVRERAAREFLRDLGHCEFVYRNSRSYLQPRRYRQRLPMSRFGEPALQRRVASRNRCTSGSRSSGDWIATKGPVSSTSKCPCGTAEAIERTESIGRAL